MDAKNALHGKSRASWGILAAMRAVSILLSAVLAFGSLFYLYGGIGALMWFGHFRFPVGHWMSFPWAVLEYAYVPAWIGSIWCFLFYCRGLVYAHNTTAERPWHLGEVLIVFGHIVLVLAGLHLTGFLIAGLDLFYGLTMLAALADSLGLAALALAFRSSSDRPEFGGHIATLTGKYFWTIFFGIAGFLFATKGSIFWREYLLQGAIGILVGSGIGFGIGYLLSKRSVKSPEGS